MPLQIVIDASIAVKWYYSTHEQYWEQAQELLVTLSHGTVSLIVPEIFLYELGNTFTRSKTSSDEVEEFWKSLFALKIQPIALDRRWCQKIGIVARTHQLTFYDAAYFAVAEEYGIDLITEDKALLATRAQFVKSLSGFR